MTIVGTYPCCGENLWLNHTDDQKMPAWRPEDCPHCGVKVWHQLSRWNPVTWTEEEFLSIHEVDYEKSMIYLRPGADNSQTLATPRNP